MSNLRGLKKYIYYSNLGNWENTIHTCLRINLTFKFWNWRGTHSVQRVAFSSFVHLVLSRCCKNGYGINGGWKSNGSAQWVGVRCTREWRSLKTTAFILGKEEIEDKWRHTYWKIGRFYKVEPQTSWTKASRAISCKERR